MMGMLHDQPAVLKAMHLSIYVIMLIFIIQNAPLHQAAQKGHMNVVRYLVEKNADITIMNNTGVSK